MNRDEAQPITLFISDLHLEKDHPETAQAFLHFLATEALKADALYILGDFFEVWIGDDDEDEFHTTIANALKQFTESGIPIYFMHGNRDFLIGKKFANRTGIKILPDPTVINLYGTRVLLMHGDSLCTLDKKHQRFRQLTHMFLIQKIFLILPLCIRKKIAQFFRRKSRSHLHHLPRYIMDVTPEAVIKVMQQHDSRILIHGHTHQPNIHHFNIDSQPVQRIVLSAWDDKASALVFHARSTISVYHVFLNAQMPLKEIDCFK